MVTETNGRSRSQQQSSGGAERGDTAPGELKWRWISADAAAHAALGEYPEMEALRKGQDLLDSEQFAAVLAEGAQEILMTSFGFALVTWGETTVGRTMNLLTVTTDMEVADIGVQEIEMAAYERGAKAIIAMGRAGWTALMQRHGYSTQPIVIFRKELNEHSIS